jgi:hypothetical protein
VLVDDLWRPFVTTFSFYSKLLAVGPKTGSYLVKRITNWTVSNATKIVSFGIQSLSLISLKLTNWPERLGWIEYLQPIRKTYIKLGHFERSPNRR